MPREDAILKAAKNHGCFVLLSKEVKDPFEALPLYRSKDICQVEDAGLRIV